MAPKPGPIQQKAPAATVYFRRIVPINPELKSGQTKPPTYIKTEDTILWPYRLHEDKEPSAIPVSTTPEAFQEMFKKGWNIQWLPRTIRYVHGLQTFFKDEQEPGGRELSRNVLDNYVNRDALVMIDGEIKIPGFDSVRIGYLTCMNQCENQHHLAKRYQNATPLYRLLDFSIKDREKVELGKLREKAYKLATDARTQDMLPHAKYLGIQFLIPETGEDRDIASIKEDYKEYALNRPQHFVDSFSDPKVKIVFWLQDLIEKAHIVINSGRAIWQQTGTEIMVIPPDKTPTDALASFAMSEAGDEFAAQLRAFKTTQLEEA